MPNSEIDYLSEIKDILKSAHTAKAFGRPDNEIILQTGQMIDRLNPPEKLRDDAMTRLKEILKSGGRA